MTAALDLERPRTTPPDLPDGVVLRVEHLSASFVYRRRTAPAIRDVTFSLPKGKTLALVGESGSGKSVTSLAILRLLAFPGRIVAGNILYRTSPGAVIDLAEANAKTMRGIRGREISMIFQEPMTSLNPLHTIERQIAEVLKIHRGMSDRAARERVLDLLDKVGIDDPKGRLA